MVSTKMSKQTKDYVGWDEAIAVAEQEISSLSRRKSRLQNAIRIFKANKKEGVPWPGGEIIGQDR
jgi:hypothetical protein